MTHKQAPGVDDVLVQELLAMRDAEPAFQEECLQAMQTQPEGQFNKSLLAYLEDRVRVNTGRPQLYGTQFYGDQNGFGPQPIEGREHLDERRAAVGLQPFADYEAQMLSMHAKTSAHN